MPAGPPEDLRSARGTDLLASNCRPQCEALLLQPPRSCPKDLSTYISCLSPTVPIQKGPSRPKYIIICGHMDPLSQVLPTEGASTITHCSSDGVASTAELPLLTPPALQNISSLILATYSQVSSRLHSGPRQMYVSFWPYRLRAL